MPKSVPISVRVSEEDAAFLATFKATGAETPSEKLRAILKEARTRQEGCQDHEAALTMFEGLLSPALRHLRQEQRKGQIRSDFLMRLHARIPELLAEMTSLTADKSDQRTEPGDLLQYEALVADRVFALIEDLLELALTSSINSYDPALLDSRLIPVLELVELIRHRRETMPAKQ